MAIVILKEKTKRAYLLALLGVVIVGIIFLVWQKFFQKSSTPSSSLPLPPEEIKINFELFRNPNLINLQPFEDKTLPSPEAEAVSLNPTLSWQSVPEAGTYLWEVVGVESGNTKETSVTVSKRLEPSTTYIWRIKACKEDMSECSLWSSRTFATPPTFISPELIYPPMEELFIKGRENPFIPY